MPSYLDFDSTKKLRDMVLSRTLNKPNGPQTFTSGNYDQQSTSDISNKDLGGVLSNVNNTLNGGTYTAFNQYQTTDNTFISDIQTLPQKANLGLYPYFTYDTHNLIGIMGTSSFDSESELFKFAANNMRNNHEGPVYARIQQNLNAISGKARILDALNGNIATASNIITGREPLVEANNKITVAKTIVGKGIDFLQTVAGVTFPFSEIPGDYLTNPMNPINYRPEAKTQLGALYQDITGAIGSIVGIQRRPKQTRKPSDLLIEYMGEGQKMVLYDSLRYNTYAPNYTTTARSQNSSKIFNFIDKVAQGVKNIIGTEAPAGMAYIGDDRGEDVKYVMNEMTYGRPVRSNYYLTLMFDDIAAQLFHRTRNIGDQGTIGGNLTWVSKNTQNKRGVNNKEWSGESSILEDSLSTNFGFRKDSILDVTQQILDSMPKTGAEGRSHVGNVIDQTTRIFKDGDTMLSKGSAIRYVDQNKQETGVEYCRVWTKDRAYFNYSDTMKTTANIRKFDGSVMGGNSRVWNLNYGPMSNGNKSFDGSTNIMDNYPYGPDADGKSFYAKKYMFSIENLAWKTSNTKGSTVLDLPYCERGPNGGRVMWFPPYDLKVSEQNNARWESNTFLGRPEPIYTYQNTERSGQVSFKVVVDHPSILNLLVREHFKNMSDEASDNYINAFFAGCKDVDLYDLVTRYTTLDTTDISYILQYLNNGGGEDIIPLYAPSVPQVVQDNPSQNETPKPNVITLNVDLKYLNDEPLNAGGKNNDYTAKDDYINLYDNLTSDTVTGRSINALDVILNTIYESTNPKDKEDKKLIFNDPMPDVALKVQKIDEVKTRLTNQIVKLKSDYTDFIAKMDGLKADISGNTVDDVTIDILSSTSAIADNSYNFKLSIRRSHAIYKSILKKVAATDPTDKWTFKELPVGNKDEKVLIERKFTYKELGFEREGSLTIRTLSAGENVPSENGDCHKSNFNNKRLRIDSPVAYGCRQSFVRMTYNQIPKNEPKVTPTKPPRDGVPETRIDVVGGIPVNNKPKKPPIGVLQRIVMKALSECYYFKKLEEDSPVAFSSLKEKLKYFHPGFHSTTPEGLNSRLTFLQQCIRPGDTIPIKGVSDALDLNARNTTFGPPPICVLRIGDFYHSKIVIRDVGITFDDGVWDLNPEGIGVQPMIANVSLQVNFIGGQGLEKPVERLQNALSSNFYANTEMYDERSIMTNTKMGGQDTSGFTKTFLEKLIKYPNGPQSGLLDNKGNKITEGNYIGDIVTISGTTKIDYTKVIDSLYLETDTYFSSYVPAYHIIENQYGPMICKMVFSQDYRTLKKYTVNIDTSQTNDVEILGLYTPPKELSTYITVLKDAINSALDSNSPTSIFDFNKDLPDGKLEQLNINFNQFLKDKVSEKLDELNDKQILTDFYKVRNNLISNLDKVNFITKYGYDVKIEKGQVIKATLEGLTNTSDFYNQYKDCVTYVKDNTSKMYGNFDDSINFNNPSLTLENLTSILKVLLVDEVSNMMATITPYEETYTTDDFDKIKSRITKFVKEPKESKFKFSKFNKRKDSNKVNYSVSLEDITTMTDEITKLYSDKVTVTDTLNYYK
jgi:hypothetical protein